MLSFPFNLFVLYRLFQSGRSAPNNSLSKISKFRALFQLRIQTKLEMLQRVLQHQQTEQHQTRGLWASYTFLHTQKMGSNDVFKFWSYHNMIYI